MKKGDLEYEVVKLKNQLAMERKLRLEYEEVIAPLRQLIRAEIESMLEAHEEGYHNK